MNGRRVDALSAVSPLSAAGSAPLGRSLAVVTACLGMMAAFLVITASIAILTPMAQALRTSSADEVWVASIYSMAVAGLGMAAGPVVGGVLLLRFSWRSVFIVTIIIAVFVLVLVPFFIPDSRSPGRRLDPAGLVLGVLAIGALSYGVIRGGNEGYAATAIVVSFCVAALSVTTPS